MRTVTSVALILLSVTAVNAQSRRALICSESVSVRFREQAAPDGSLVEAIANSRFSFVWNDEFLNVISAGKTDFYECSNIKPRLNEGGPKSAIKCQNGMYFFTIDLTKLTFVRATLDPRAKANVEVTYGSCRAIDS